MSMMTVPVGVVNPLPRAAAPPPAAATDAASTVAVIVAELVAASVSAPALVTLLTDR